MDVEGGTTNPLISRGLGALALSVYNDMAPADILGVDPAFFQQIGLNVGLSPTRSNGFASLLKQIYLYARVFDAFSKK
jgi:cysteine desulfuration protein SufE